MAVQLARLNSRRRKGWGPAPTPPTLSSASVSMRTPSMSPTKCIPSASVTEALSTLWVLLSVCMSYLPISKCLEPAGSKMRVFALVLSIEWPDGATPRALHLHQRYRPPVLVEDEDPHHDQEDGEGLL